MPITDGLLCPAETAARAGRRRNVHVCAHHVGQRQCISLQPRALLSSVSIVRLCTSNTKQYLPSSAFDNRLLMLISSSEFSFWLPSSKCIHLVLMTLKTAGCRQVAGLQVWWSVTHTRIHTHLVLTPLPFSSAICCAGNVFFCLPRLGSPAPQGCSPDLPSVRLKESGGREVPLLAGGGVAESGVSRCRALRSPPRLLRARGLGGPRAPGCGEQRGESGRGVV